MSRYLLSAHAFACETGRHAVFLDLRRGKYTAVPPEDLPAVRAAVQGWSAGMATGSSAATTVIDELEGDGAADASDDDAIRMLLSEGLLTTRTSAGKQVAPVRVKPATTSLVEGIRVWPQFTSHHLRGLLSAWAMTTLMLRVAPMRWIVRRARYRKERLGPAAPPVTIARMQQLVAMHFVLQPAFYPLKDNCLRNSALLVEFLARYQVYPTWVFGVKMQPFAAHCWVQHGSVLLMDTLESVSSFTPIMAI